METTKDKLQIILNKMEAIPKSEDKQIEFDNMAPLLWELKLLQMENEKEFEKAVKENANDEIFGRQMRSLYMNDGKDWREYKEKMKALITERRCEL